MCQRIYVCKQSHRSFLVLITECVHAKQNTRLLILTTVKLQTVERDFRNFSIAAHCYVMLKNTIHNNAEVMNSKSIRNSSLLLVIWKAACCQTVLRTKEQWTIGCCFATGWFIKRVQVCAKAAMGDFTVQAQCFSNDCFVSQSVYIRKVCLHNLAEKHTSNNSGALQNANVHSNTIQAALWQCTQHAHTVVVFAQFTCSFSR